MNEFSLVAKLDWQEPKGYFNLPTESGELLNLVFCNKKTFLIHQLMNNQNYRISPPDKSPENLYPTT